MFVTRKSEIPAHVVLFIEFLAEIKEADTALRTGSGEGNDFIGWLGLPENIDKEELARVKKSAEKIISDSEVLLVVGIGGSYLGSRAVIEFIKSETRYSRLAQTNPERAAALFAKAAENAKAKYERLTRFTELYK